MGILLASTSALWFQLLSGSLRHPNDIRLAKEQCDHFLGYNGHDDAFSVDPSAQATVRVFRSPIL